MPRSPPEGCDRASPETCAARRRATLWIWLANVFFGALIGRAYLRDLPAPETMRVALFAHLGLLSTVLTWTLPLGLGLLLLAGSRARNRSVGNAGALLWTLFQLALYTDTRIYGLFRYHFGSAAWNLMTSPGSDDSFRIGPRIWITALAISLAIFAAHQLAWRRLLASGMERLFLAGARGLARPALVCFALLFVAVCVEKSIYAQADLTLDREVRAVSQVFPMYPRVRLKSLLPQAIQSRLADDPRIAVAIEGARLEWPRERPSFRQGAPRPNVLVLVIDSWRRDMLDERVTPRLWRLAADARRFDDHLSGGNGTRFGVFSLLYGLHGSYWWPVLEARRSPLLVDALLDRGYEGKVFSSASMEFPEFRQTAWSRIPGAVLDDFGDRSPSVRDELAAQSCAGWWRDRDPARPFFAFVLLDSAHQPYDFPEGRAPFRPYAQHFDYLEMAGSRDPTLAERVKHRYMNALHHADSVAGWLLDELARSGSLENTLVVVTADHGEEFAENGYWGHTGNFTPEQVAVPFLLRGPGVAPGIETRPTAHVDVACTLLELCGADPGGRAGWTNGTNLLDPPAWRERAVAGWDEVGLWTRSGIFRIPRQADSPYCASVCDDSWELLPAQEESFRREAQALARLSRECLRFLDRGKYPGRRDAPARDPSGAFVETTE
jgi:membrane-anchored protein YejM (alkaline phosphatase superfamily)